MTQVEGMEDAMTQPAKLSPMRRIPWQLLAAGTLTAVLLDLPFPLAGPLPAWRSVFAWVALTPLCAVLLRVSVTYGASGVRWRLAWSFVAGWLTGALWFGANCYWVYQTMHLYGGMGPALAALSLVLFSLYLGFWFGAFGLALGVVVQAGRVTARPWLAVAAIPFLWTAMEFALARVPEFPWDLLGYSQVDNGLLTRLAPWTGVYGISFVVAGVNAWLAGSLVGTRLRMDLLPWSWIGRVAVMVAFVLSAGILFVPPKSEGTATAVLVQPNLDVTGGDWTDAEWNREMAQFGKLAKQSCGRSFMAGMPETGAAASVRLCGAETKPPVLVLWPEGPAPFHSDDPHFLSSMETVAQAAHAPMIVGALGEDLATGTGGAPQFRIFNSAEVIGADGREIGRYDKMHLVPFGEYVPMREALFFVQQITQVSDLQKGSERKVFPLDGRRYGVFICYESVFGNEIRQFAKNGAEVLVNISDDGWYGDTSAPWQHLNMARMRAIENRRWILRDTNNGATVAIDPYGTVRQSIPRHRVGALAAQFGYETETTFYTRHGDWWAWICAVVALGLVGWGMRTVVVRG